MTDIRPPPRPRSPLADSLIDYLMTLLFRASLATYAVLVQRVKGEDSVRPTDFLQKQ